MTRKQFLLTILGIPAIVKAVKVFEKQDMTHNLIVTRSGHTTEFFKDGEPVDLKDRPFYYCTWDTEKSELRIHKGNK